MTVVIEPNAASVNGANILYRNMFLEGLLSASSEAADGFADNAVDGETWDFWTPTAVPAWIKVSADAAFTADCACIAAHTLASSGAILNVQYSADNADWITVSTVDAIVDDTIMIFFPAASARYWRFYITGAIPTIGVAFIGERLKFANGVLSGHTSLHNSKESTVLTNVTVSGQKRRSRVIRRGIEATINFGLVDTDFADGIFQPFKEHYNNGGDFFYAGSPLNWPKDIGYCWRPEGSQAMKPPYVESGILTELSMEVSAYAG